MKISNMLLGGNLFFFITALIGFILIRILLENSINLFLIILIFLIFSNNYMFQNMWNQCGW